ncbi:hypothetical protein JXA56_04570 [Candidatus Micrarchaeota archaeon]|nr:hypothetical protein [Candidatus Micrarchaeota archaeon]
MDVEPPTNDPCVKIERYLDSLHKNREKILERCKKIKKLNYENRWDASSKDLCYDIIHQLYIGMITCYAVNQYYPALDSCRKTIEYLVRFELSFPPNKRMDDPKGRIDNIAWDDEVKEEAKAIYDFTKRSIHYQKYFIWRNSPGPKTRIQHYPGLTDELKIEIEEYLSGVKNVEKKTLEIMNRTITIANTICKTPNK